MLHPRAVISALLLFASSCDGADGPPDAPPYQLPAGDPDGGGVAGTLATDLGPAEAQSARLFVGAWQPDGGLLVAVDLGMVTFPAPYRLDNIPAGGREIHALLDVPPFAAQPLLERPSFEDATGAFPNAQAPLAVEVRPGLVTTRINFLASRRP